MVFEKLPAVDDRTLSMDCRIGVGFGHAGYSRDGEEVWRESRKDEWHDLPTVADVEAIAASDPDHDWRIFFFGPLSEAVFQRQGDGVWVKIKRGIGFA